MRILVTGGAGFIASHVVDGYIGLGHEVIVVDNLSTGKKEFVNPKAKFYQVDIKDKKKIQDIFNKEKPQILNHHAAQISVRESVIDPVNDAEINILGFLSLLELGRNNGLRKVIFASSGGVVYGEAEKIPTAEDYKPLNPLSPYGVSKLTSEYYLNYYHKTYGIDYLALRYANVYGPRQNPHGEAGVVAIFSSKLLKGEIPTINGDGLQTRDYVYVGDITAANLAALETPASGAFNVGTGIETNVLKLYQSLTKIIGTNISFKNGSVKSGEQKRSCLDPSLAKKVFGWEAKTELTHGLQKTVEYFKKQIKS